jgi:hypothetical protein
VWADLQALFPRSFVYVAQFSSAFFSTQLSFPDEEFLRKHLQFQGYGGTIYELVSAPTVGGCMRM